MAKKMTATIVNSAIVMTGQFVLLLSPIIPDQPMGVVIMFINKSVYPFKRGFFCDDESIQHPSRKDSISTPLMYGMGFFLNIASFLVIEGIHLWLHRKKGQTSSHKLEEEKNNSSEINTVYISAVYNALLPFMYGAAVVQLVTDIAKYSVGRLRPNFIDVCQPDLSMFNCSDGYITADVCTGIPSLVRHGRTSFPSGHTSFSVYSMLFLVFYFQARLKFTDFLLLRPFLQLIVFCWAYYTGLSRIHDYKHHWSDVLGGAIIGFIVTLLTVGLSCRPGKSLKSL